MGKEEMKAKKRIVWVCPECKDLKHKAFWILKSVENWRGPDGKDIGEPLLTCIKAALENFK